MAKTLRETAISTRNARSKLDAGVYWKGIDPDVHLGYRKSKRGGVWLVRWRVPPGYRQAPLGTADDAIGEGTLDYNAAVRQARKHVETARKDAKAAADGPLLTVRLIVEEYIAARDARDARRKGRAVRSDANSRLSRYLLGQEKRGTQPAIRPKTLASVPLHALTEQDLVRWRDDLPETMKASSKQRTINDMKAALNAAYGAHRGRLDPTLPAVVKHALKADAHDSEESEPLARDNQILTDAQIARLIRAAREIDAEEDWDSDLYRMVIVLTATGARFSQVARMRVGDCQRKQGRMLVPPSRKGRGAKGGSIAVPVGTDVLGALQSAVTGRPTDAPLLERWRHKQVGGGKDGIAWERAGRGAWRSPAELIRPWQSIRERAKMPEVIPYSLRHSSIVRGIRANLPLRLVAALHDTSVAMIERHYAKWIVDGLEELAARAVVPLVPAEKKSGKVVPMARQGAW